MNNKIKRLSKLSGTDAGFYILAIHSFIEAYMKGRYSGFDPEASFADNMNYMQNNIGRESSIFLPTLKETFRHLRIEHEVTNSVRHKFQFVTTEKAKDATSNFLQFCELAGINEEALKDLGDSLNAWDDRRSKIEIAKELGVKGFESHMRKLEITSLENKLKKWHQGKTRKNTSRNSVSGKVKFPKVAMKIPHLCRPDSPEMQRPVR